MRLVLAAAVAVTLVLAACGRERPAPSSSEAAPTTAPADVSALRYTCDDRFDFTADLLARPGTDEQAGTPAAAALRAHLAKPDMEIDWLPDTGWTLLGQDAEGAVFVAHGGDDELFSVSVEVVDGAWHVDGWGGCTPMRVPPPGLGDATWALAPDAAIGPETTEFTALVTERECASGRPSAGRVVGPDILLLEDRVLVTFAVRPLGGDAQDCPSNPATPVTVILPEPLGDRQLLDGSTLPPRDPAAQP